MYEKMYVFLCTYGVFGLVGLCVHVLEVWVSECFFFFLWNSELVYCAIHGFLGFLSFSLFFSFFWVLFWSIIYEFCLVDLISLSLSLCVCFVIDL
jgi:hypothetical protein